MDAIDNVFVHFKQWFSKQFPLKNKDRLLPHTLSDIFMGPHSSRKTERHCVANSHAC